MIRNFHRLISITLACLVLSGCWNYNDINKRSIVLSVGIDGVKDKVELTGEIAKILTTGGRAELTDVYEYQALGKDIEESREHRDARIASEAFSGAARSLVFSRRYAETVGMESYINRRYYIPEFKGSILVVVSKEPTKDLFSGKVDNDICIGYAIEDTIKTLSKNGEALHKTMQQIKSDIEFKDIGYFAPYITKAGNTVEYLGLAAMKDSKLIGTVKREDSYGILFILSKNPVTIIPIPHPSDKENLISTRNSLKERKISTDFKENKINININLKLNTQIQYLYEMEPVNKRDMENLESMISHKIKEEIIKALELSKTQYKCDVFGFARYFQGDYPEEYKQMKWEEEYSNINFNVNVKTTVTNTNLMDVNAKKKAK